MGFVPEYEQREAAVYAHVSWFEYEKATNVEKAAIVAHYRMHSLIEAHASASISRHNELMTKAEMSN
jgi:hypothetical protein